MLLAMGEKNVYSCHGPCRKEYTNYSKEDLEWTVHPDTNVQI